MRQIVTLELANDRAIAAFADVEHRIMRDVVHDRAEAPGQFATDRLRSAFETRARASGKPYDEVRDAALDATPAGRFGDPREFGAICAFLCSVHAGYIAGQNVLADGGAYPGTF